jgi:hypothetical protein
MQQQAGWTRRRSDSGFSNQQALLAILVAIPVGLIGLGLILNMLNKPSLQQRPVQPAAEPTQQESLLTPDPPSKQTESTEPTPDNSFLDLGDSVSGAPIRLLLNSIRPGEGSTRAFTYQLGNATVKAIANCADRSWISYPERRINWPQSPATEQLLMRVCGGSAEPALAGVAIVHDPPSNVRDRPNGASQCTIESRRTIRVGQTSGDWYETTACGGKGFIHRSQLQF